jgi:hypothetical protein
MYLEDIYDELDYRLEESAPAALRPRRETAAQRHAKAIKASDKGTVTSGYVVPHSRPSPFILYYATSS